MSALASLLTGGDVGEAIGIGAFLAFWIGCGFGVILGGALWNHDNEEHLFPNE